MPRVALFGFRGFWRVTGEERKIMKDVYQRLAEFLDTMPQRYPVNTESGIELRIL